MKTLSDLRPGKEEDVVQIAIYQGDDNAEGKTAALFEYVSDITISGEDIVSFIPESSRINIKIDVDRSEMMTITAEFPESGQIIEKRLDTSRRQATKDTDYLQMQISQAYTQIHILADAIEETNEVSNHRTQMKQIEDALNSGAQHKQIEQHLKEVFRHIEEYEQSTEWDRQHNRLQKALMSLQIEAIKHKAPRVTKMVESFNVQVERVANLKDINKTRSLQVQIENYKYSLTRDEIYRKRRPIVRTK